MKDSKVYFCLKNIDRIIEIIKLLKLPAVFQRSVNTTSLCTVEKQSILSQISFDPRLAVVTCEFRPVRPSVRLFIAHFSQNPHYFL